MICYINKFIERFISNKINMMSWLILLLGKIKKQKNTTLSCKEVTRKSLAIKNLFEMLPAELVLNHTPTHRAVKFNLIFCFINSWFVLTFDQPEGFETQEHWCPGISFFRWKKKLCCDIPVSFSMWLIDSLKREICTHFYLCVIICFRF